MRSLTELMFQVATEKGMAGPVGEFEGRDLTAEAKTRKAAKRGLGANSDRLKAAVMAVRAG